MSEQLNKLLDEYFTRRERRESAVEKGRGRAIAQGLTFGFADEIEAAFDAMTSDQLYSERIKEIRQEQADYAFMNPGESFLLETAGALPTGLGLAGGLAKAGVKSIAKQGGIEGAVYGAGSGESFEGRVLGATAGGFAGMTLGKVIDAAITPSSAGGLKTKADELADKAEAINDQGQLRAIEEAEDAAVYAEVDNPRYTVKPLREAQTAGELWDGLTGALKKFYDDKLTGVSDRLMRNVSAAVGGRYQIADESALRVIDKDLGNLQERLIPVIKVINEDERALGVLLDFGAGKLGKGFADSVRRLEKELADDLNAENMASLKQYLAYSYRKNRRLNKKVFGADFGDITYLHTRNRGLQKRLKDEGRTDDEIERLFDDPGFEKRTRGSYLDEADGTTPNPLDYENPIVSDMRRIFKMERLNQIQRKFGVNINDYKKVKQRRLAEERSFAVTPTGELAVDPIGLQRGLSEPVGPLTPTEFMEAFEQTLTKKGISAEGAAYARQQINDAIMGQGKAPHPLIQAANSLAYALTLAGPLSAVLNLADIPLVGAKYGGAAAREGMKAIPNPFTKIPNADLKKMGLSNQTFGEFVNILNDQASDSAGWMTKTAEKMRNTANFLMKGSGFVALDQVGKKGVMRGVLKSAMDDANAGNLADNWGFYFNKAELDILSNQLQKHGMDWTKYTGKGAELVEELMFAGLGQQQLISAAGRPAAWARHPNLRPLWALRGFVVKQQALALREVMGNLKAGRPEKAAEFLGRYAVYGAGGYAAINEGRQFIFGDGEASFSGAARGYGDAWASLLTANTLGLNDYQFGKIKENGIMLTFAQGLLPIAVTRPFDIAGTAIGVADREYPVARLASELPIVRDVGRVSRNIGERAGIQPLEDVGGMLTQKRLEEN